jgi:hypothetical protein
VRFLLEERRYVVQVGPFRGELEVEEAAFFAREVDLEAGEVLLSDSSREPLDLATLRESPRDGAWIVTVKRDLAPGGLPARFTHAAQAAVLGAVEESVEGVGVRIAGRFVRL